MGKSFKALILSIFVMVLVVVSGTLNAQAPAPPDPPGSHGTGINQGPLQSAPIDGGLTVFLAFAAVAAGRELRKKK